MSHQSSTLNHHELSGQALIPRRGSDRAFGITFAVVFAVVALMPVSRGGEVRPSMLALAVLLASVAVALPALLRPLSVVWFRLGLFMHRFTSPLLLGIVYFLVITPTAVIQRARGRDLLRLRPDPKAPTYWLPRLVPERRGPSLRRQF